MTGWRDALREMGRRRGRSLLTLLSVVIAVAAIVAVTSATATTRQAYRQVFEALAGRADLEIVARGGGRFHQRAADAIRGLPGVRTIVPIFHKATKLYGPDNQATVLAIGIEPDNPESIAGYELIKGQFPARGNEIALEEQLADGLGIELGREVNMLTGRGPRRHKVVGLVRLEAAVRLHQGGMLLAPVSRLQYAFKLTGQVDALHVYLQEGTSRNQVIDEAERLLPPELRIRVPSSRSGLAEETLLLTEVSLNMASALSFTTAVFIALSVFLMNVGERRRQLSILRALGATRRQIIWLVCREALLVGIIGTLLGIPLGVYGGTLVIDSMATMLNTSLPPTPDLRWALAAGIIVGPVICLIAAWYPAHRASLVSPLEGMRPAVTLNPEAGHGGTTIAGCIGLAITLLLTVLTLTGDIPIWAAVAGMIISLVSIILLMPLALTPTMRLLAWPLRRFLSVEGEMSQRMVLRHAGRSSLTIGVLFMAVAAGVGTSNAVFSITDDIRTWYERTITADFLLRAAMPDMSGQDSTSMPESLRAELMKLPGVQTAEAIRLLRIEANGQDAVLVAREFEHYSRAPLDIIRGDEKQALHALRAGGVVVGSVLAERLGVKPGGEVKVIFGDQTHTFPVAAIATEYTFGGSVLYADRAVAAKLFHIEDVDSFLIRAKPGQAEATEPALRKLAREHGLLLQSFGELMRLIDSMVAGVTGGLWVLLTLGLLVGALGVINTLTMNVIEQTRELGMLRAIGMRRWQIVRTVLGQATYIGLLGVVGGALSGVILARMINFSLATLFGHYIPFALRPEFVLLLMLAALAVVVVSALFPARRAAMLSPIESMRQE